LARDSLRIFNTCRNNITNIYAEFNDNCLINHVTLPDGLYTHFLHTST